MACNCKFKHTTTALSTAGLLTFTDPTNIGNFERFCFILTINPDDVITTAPVAYTATINGTAVPLVDIWGYPITSDRLLTRCLYKGRYVAGTSPHITIKNALSNEAESALASEKTGA